METPGSPPPPGSDAAIDEGCICPILDNGHGKGYMGIEGTYVIAEGCPLHVPPKADGEPS